MPAKEPKRDFKVGDKVRVNLHHGKIEDAVVRAVIHDDDGIKLKVDVVGLNLTALIDTRRLSSEVALAQHRSAYRKLRLN